MIYPWLGDDALRRGPCNDSVQFSATGRDFRDFSDTMVSPSDDWKLC